MKALRRYILPIFYAIILFLLSTTAEAQATFQLKEMGIESIEQQGLDSSALQQELKREAVLLQNQGKPIDWREEAKKVGTNRTKNNDHTLLFYLYCLILTLYGYINYRYGKLQKSIQRMLSSLRLSRQSFEEEYSEMLFPLSLLFLNTVAILGVLVYYLFQYLEVFPQLNYYQSLFLSMGLVFLFLLIKYVIQTLLSIITPESNSIQFYLYNKLVIYSALGILLLPIVIVFSFSSFLPKVYGILIGIVIVLIFTAFLMYRGLLTNRNLFQFHPFHFFLYLCALEIAPVLILWRIYSTS